MLDEKQQNFLKKINEEEDDRRNTMERYNK